MNHNETEAGNVARRIAGMFNTRQGTQAKSAMPVAKQSARIPDTATTLADEPATTEFKRQRAACMAQHGSLNRIAEFWRPRTEWGT